MGRQSGDSMVVGSSIALLQERFRQLERAREKRQLLKLFSEPEKITPTTPSEPEIIFPSTPPLQDSLSLGLGSQRKHADFRAIKTTPPSINLRSTDAALVSTSQRFENSEVDTSLRL